MNKRRGEKFLNMLPAGVDLNGGKIECLLLREYGAMFAATGVTLPTKVIFADAKDVDSFQASLQSSTRELAGHQIKLQSPAMDALTSAAVEASNKGLSITPRGGDAAQRDYTQTLELWASRVEPALEYWQTYGRISRSDCRRIRSLEGLQQIAEILRLERDGIFFAKDFSKSIIYSVAPPGASQHLSLLAFDVMEFDNADVRTILSQHGWFQTVVSDLPHFTYLGRSETELGDAGLKRVEAGGRHFWLPDI